MNNVSQKSTKDGAESVLLNESAESVVFEQRPKDGADNYLCIDTGISLKIYIQRHLLAAFENY